MGYLPLSLTYLYFHGSWASMSNPPCSFLLKAILTSKLHFEMCDRHSARQVSSKSLEEIVIRINHKVDSFIQHFTRISSKLAQYLIVTNLTYL